MAKVTIGEKTYIIPELNFIAMEKAWAAIQLTMTLHDPIQAVGAAIEVIGAALQEAPDFKPADFNVPEGLHTIEEVDLFVTQYLKRQLKASQIGHVQVALDDIIEEAGLRPEPGEPLTQETSPGMETLDPSSLPLSPQELKAGHGIE